MSKFPIQLIFAIGFLFYIFGLALLSAAGIGIIVAILNFIISKVRASLQKKKLKVKDERMRSTTEAINSIKVIKLYSWRDMFIQKVLKSRNKELFLYKMEVILDSFEVFFVWMASPLLIISTFLTFFLMGNTISVARAFAAIQVFTYIELPLRWFPDFIKSYFEFTVSMRRIQRFLKCSEINGELLKINDKNLQNMGRDLQIRNANFTWGGLKNETDEKKDESENKEEEKEKVEVTMNLTESILLKNLNIEIDSGEFVCIIGEVGSGKSSLINAILGDMIYIDELTLRELGDNLMNDETRDIICQR